MLPFAVVIWLFVFEPALLMQDTGVGELGLAVATAVAGIWLVSAALVGYGLRRMPALSRLVAGVSGAALLMPPTLSDWSGAANIAGAALGAALLASEYARRGGRAAPAPGAAEQERIRDGYRT